MIEGRYFSHTWNLYSPYCSSSVESLFLANSAQMSTFRDVCSLTWNYIFIFSRSYYPSFRVSSLTLSITFICEPIFIYFNYEDTDFSSNEVWFQRSLNATSLFKSQILSKYCMVAYITKIQIFHFMKFDLNYHWSSLFWILCLRFYDFKKCVKQVLWFKKKRWLDYLSFWNLDLHSYG